jgi:hypothetical protein
MIQVMKGDENSIMNATETDERRRFRRLPAAELHVKWRPRKGLFGSFQPTNGYDFTRDGLSIIAPEGTFSTGDRVELRLELRMEAGSMNVDRLLAQVVNQRSHDGPVLYGLAFDYAASRSMRSAEKRAQLGRIEGILERGEKLKLRLQPLQEINGLAE